MCVMVVVGVAPCQCLTPAGAKKAEAKPKQIKVSIGQKTLDSKPELSKAEAKAEAKSEVKSAGKAA